jgi:hypothetical protein
VRITYDRPKGPSFSNASFLANPFNAVKPGQVAFECSLSSSHTPVQEDLMAVNKLDIDARFGQKNRPNLLAERKTKRQQRLVRVLAAKAQVDAADRRRKAMLVNMSTPEWKKSHRKKQLRAQIRQQLRRRWTTVLACSARTALFGTHVERRSAVSLFSPSESSEGEERVRHCHTGSACDLPVLSSVASQKAVCTDSLTRC